MVDVSVKLPTDNSTDRQSNVTLRHSEWQHLNQTQLTISKQEVNTENLAAFSLVYAL